MFKINVLALGVVLHLTEVQVLHSLIIFIVIDLFYRTIESTQTNPARAYIFLFPIQILYLSTLRAQSTSSNASASKLYDEHMPCNSLDAFFPCCPCFFNHQCCEILLTI